MDAFGVPRDNRDASFITKPSTENKTKSFKEKKLMAYLKQNCDAIVLGKALRTRWFYIKLFMKI